MSLSARMTEIITRIDKALSSTKIEWAITGSCSLALQGMALPVHDLDLRTTVEGAYQIEEIFKSYSIRPVSFKNSGAFQSHFGAFKIGSTEVEIIGDMLIRCEGGSFWPTQSMDHFMIWVPFNNLKLPVMSAAFLYESYKRMGRHEKSMAVKQWLEQYVESPHAFSDLEELMNQLNHVNAGRKFGRNELNER